MAWSEQTAAERRRLPAGRRLQHGGPNGLVLWAGKRRVRPFQIVHRPDVPPVGFVNEDATQTFTKKKLF